MNIITNNIKASVKSFFRVIAIASVLSSLSVVIADDTEVFYSVNVSKPNLMFVLDISGSMSNTVPGSGDPAGTTNHSVERQIADWRDDAEQRVSGGSMYINDSYLDMGYDYYDFNGLGRLGLRFFDLEIPQGAEITNAYIQFEVAQATSEASEYSIVGEASDDAKRFSSSDPIHTRTVTSNSVEWHPLAWVSRGDRGARQRTPDLAAIVQNIVSRDNWSDDNGMVFIIEGTGNRVAKSRDWGYSESATLHVDYKSTGVTGDKTRLEVMQTAIRRVLETAPDNVNVGLMNYGQENLNIGGDDNHRHQSVSGVAFPISDINALVKPILEDYDDVDTNLPNPASEAVTVRDYLADVADSWDHNSWTPIVDSLYEAALYFRGEKIHYGQSSPTKGGAHPTTYEGDTIFEDVTVVGRDRSTAPKYISPMQSSCQSNYIVLMTDGAPTYRKRNANGNWYSTKGPFHEKIKGNSAYGALAGAISTCKTAAGSQVQGTCGEDITHYLATHDNNSEFDGNQFIDTFAIGFGSGLSSNAKDYLKSLATINDDPATSVVEKGYFEADSAEALAKAFRDILDQVAEPTGTLASPGYSVNVKSGLEHEKDIYIPVFDRKNTSRWAGNLKKFRLKDVAGKRIIKGKNNLNAVDELGGFTSNALDYWSSSDVSDPDGTDIQKGGLANKLVPDDRLLFSNLDCAGSGPCALNTDKNKLTEDNAKDSGTIKNNLLDPDSEYGVNTEDDRKNLMRFIRGINEDGTPRYHMGDMLHSEPLIITYAKEGSPGGKKQYIFAASNEGYLHAFDTVTGEEKFAFMPKELLRNIEPQFRNEGTAKDHKYGIDGTITYWQNDEHIYLYFGMRRGGRSFYALDVTDINNPKLLWRKAASDSGLSGMGQSWSAPYLAKVGVKSGGSVVNKEVVIVSGGYDKVEDRDGLPASASVNTTMGNDIFIFDAEEGYRIWSLGDSLSGTNPIKDSVPGGVRILDVNRNGLIDRMYFADTGGHVWRLDLSEEISKTGTNDSVSTDSTSKLTLFASLGDSSQRNGSRKFFNEPDVAHLRHNGKTMFAVSLGSGFRAHPMDKSINDRFYMLKDENALELWTQDEYNEDFETIEIDELSKIDISGSIGSITINKDEDFDDPEQRGWFVKLPEDGEKVLATPVTFNGVVVFTTLVPEALLTGDGVDQCAAPSTQGRLYAINILTGEAGLDLDLSGNNPVTQPEDKDAAMLTIKGEIPGKPQIIFNAPEILQDNNGKVTQCSHPVDIRVGKKLSQATGYEACRLESLYWNDPPINDN